MTEDSRDPSGDSYPHNEDAFREFIDGPRDEFVCNSCGSKAYRTYPEEEPGAIYAEVDGDPAVVCYECDDNFEWETIETRIRKRRRAAHRPLVGDWLTRFRAVLRPVHTHIPVPLSVHEIAPERRDSLLPEQTVFVGRVVTILGFVAAVLAGVAVFAALTGALFLSPDTGVRWFATTLNIYRESVLFLVARPFLVLGVIGLGYVAHLVEYQRHVTDLDRDTGRTRPRWHYLTICAGGGLLGWFGWLLSQLNALGSVFLPIGVLTWSAGTFGLVYFLHATLLEDRWSYGLQIHPAIWKFPVQYAVGLMLYDGVIGLPGPESNTLAVAIVPLVAGLFYAARRYFAFTERGAAFSGWVRQLTYRWHQMVPWPSTSRFEGRGDSPETDQFGQLEESMRDEHEGDVDGASRLDREEELRQTREWASYLESELHDREEQLQDLEARLAQVRQELQDTRAADSNDDSTAGEREDLLTDLFDIRDNFQRALDAETVLEDDAAAEITDGIELIDRQIKSILEREGVQEIDTSGTVDPTRHQVVKTVPATDADPGDIVDVYRLGYRLDDRVLREARVVVAEESVTDEGGDAADDDSQVNRGGDAS